MNHKIESLALSDPSQNDEDYYIVVGDHKGLMSIWTLMDLHLKIPFTNVKYNHLKDVKIYQRKHLALLLSLHEVPNSLIITSLANMQQIA